MCNAWRNALANLRGKNNRTAVVIGADQIAVHDAAGRRVLGVHPDDPVVVAVQQHAGGL